MNFSGAGEAGAFAVIPFSSRSSVPEACPQCTLSLPKAHLLLMNYLSLFTPHAQ